MGILRAGGEDHIGHIFLQVPYHQFLISLIKEKRWKIYVFANSKVIAIKKIKIKSG